MTQSPIRRGNFWHLVSRTWKLELSAGHESGTVSSWLRTLYIYIREENEGRVTLNDGSTFNEERGNG